MSKWIQVKLHVEDEAIAQVLIDHGAVMALENTIKQLQQWFDDNNPTEPGNVIPDWWLGYRKAVNDVKEILDGGNQ